MEHHTTTSRAEAERLLGIAEKLLGNKDLTGSRDFAILAQETEPLLEGSDQILAVAEVLLASDKKLNNNHHDWYSILQVPLRTNDAELIKKQYRRLALLLHPDKNIFAFADAAFHLVADAWAVLSDSSKKAAYDSESAAAVARFTKVDLTKKSMPKMPVRRSSNKKNVGTPVQTNTRSNSYSDEYLGSFWTSCPYCHNLYEYPRVYESCCLRCDNENCRRAFTGAEILSMPPIVPGKDAYYCCWGVFPMGFVEEGRNGNDFPKWMPPMFGDAPVVSVPVDAAPVGSTLVEAASVAAAQVIPAPVTAAPVTAAPVAAAPIVAAPVGAGQIGTPGPKKRGRPRKNL